MQSWFHSDSRCFSSPLSLLHLYASTVSPLQQVSVKRRRRKKKKSYVKASQSESNHWPSTAMIGLITVRQMQLARHSYKILQQEIHSVPFNLFQEVTTLREGQAPPPKQQFPYKKWIHCVRRSNSDPPAIKLRDSLQVTPAKWLEMYSSHYFSLLSILLLPVDCWKAASKGTRYICF